MFNSLIRARFVLLGLVLVTLGGLLGWGRRVQYEQSLTSFFPETDPAVVAYQESSERFGNDNIVFLAYDDPALLTPAGMERLEELTRSVDPAHISAVLNADSLASQPLFWTLDDALTKVESLPSFLRAGDRALLAARSLVSQATMPTIASAIRSASAEGLPALRERIVSHPLLRGLLVSPTGTSAVVVIRLKGMAEQDAQGDGRLASRRGRLVRGAARPEASRAGWPSGLAGRWFRRDRKGRTSAGDRRNAFDRGGDVLRDPEPVVGRRADRRGMDGLAGGRDGAGVAGPEALAFGGGLWSRRSSS